MKITQDNAADRKTETEYLFDISALQQVVHTDLCSKYVQCLEKFILLLQCYHEYHIKQDIRIFLLIKHVMDRQNEGIRKR